jgi:hypothetical protein
VVGARRAHADGFAAGQPGRFGDELQDIGDDPLPAEAGLRRPALPGQDLSCLVDETGLDLGPAQVDADGETAHCRSPKLFYANEGILPPLFIFPAI